MAIYDIAHTYFDKSNKKSAADDFDVLLDIVNDLQEDAAEQAEFIQDKLVGFCQQEAMKEALLESIEDIQNGKFAEVEARIQKAQSIGAELDGSGIYLLADADSRQTIEESRIVVPTGFDCVDGPLRGGLGKRELTIFMAPPNVGKTNWLINLGTGAAKRGKKVVHITLELSALITRGRYDQCLLGKTDAELSSIDEVGRQKLSKWMKNLRKNLGADIYIKEFPAHKLSIAGLRAHIMMLKARDGFDLDLLLLDYLDLLEMPTHIRDEVKQLAWLGVELRALCGSLGCAGATVTQTNRGGISKETAMGEDIAGDFTKLATADALASINQTKKEAEEDKARLVWLKNRVGRKFGSYDLITDFERSTYLPG